jgi:hypothetical protein
MYPLLRPFNPSLTWILVKNRYLWSKPVISAQHAVAPAEVTSILGALGSPVEVGGNAIFVGTRT